MEIQTEPLDLSTKPSNSKQYNHSSINFLTGLNEHLLKLCERTHLLESTHLLSNRSHLLHGSLDKKGLLCSTLLDNNRDIIGSALCSDAMLTNASLFTRNAVMGKSRLLQKAGTKNVLPCQVCLKTFDRPSLLKRHMRTHTGEKPHICNICSKGFSTSSSLNTHRRIHTGEKPHKCPECGKCFTASSNLYYHRMTHTKNKPHKCPACPRSFPTPGELRAHAAGHARMSSHDKMAFSCVDKNTLLQLRSIFDNMLPP